MNQANSWTFFVISDDAGFPVARINQVVPDSLLEAVVPFVGAVFEYRNNGINTLRNNKSFTPTRAFKSNWSVFRLAPKYVKPINQICRMQGAQTISLKNEITPV